MPGMLMTVLTHGCRSRTARYYEASRRCERFYVSHSPNDQVLRLWYRVGDLPNFDTALGQVWACMAGLAVRRINDENSSLDCTKLSRGGSRNPIFG